MKLINKTKNKIIATNVIDRKGTGAIIGLIPYKIRNEYIYDYLKWRKFGENDVMVFKVRGKGSVHTWFMSFPISVFFLNKDMKVTDKVKLEPFEIYKPKKKYEYFIELDSSWIDEIRIGDKLNIE
ncbi:MAG: hypothetical protein GF368_05005 [Candidatus Aenigmarchaeota archaeon]|nr:hypothetical protein [Candidatus Aenigmarchaeota archaeon]